jgi:hypothetical protein
MRPGASNFKIIDIDQLVTCSLFQTHPFLPRHPRADVVGLDHHYRAQPARVTTSSTVAPTRV